jgi:23S rRNA (cytidine1920-2'-O)/16S rRNA (cytidine1409-2'-O)-methyltransferase
MTARLDQELVDRGLCASREKAKRLILAGRVRVNEHPVTKAGVRVKPADTVRVEAGDRYVSRGGEKLEHGLRHFGIDVTDRVAVDLGASTGGFTDCLLQHGAACVYAVDVGHGQLAWPLRQDPRVVVMERTNARQLTMSAFPVPFAGADLVVIDCSFISLRLLLKPAAGLLRSGGRVLTLVKPQFEAGRAEASRGGGVIRDPAIHQRVLQELEVFVQTVGRLRWLGVTHSPLLGPAGNREFFVLLEQTDHDLAAHRPDGESGKAGLS